MSDLDRVCDRRDTPLIIHGDTLAGAGCDLSLAMSDFWRALLIGVLGERRGWRAWWVGYDRRRT